jgi:hypothetical protein
MENNLLYGRNINKLVYILKNLYSPKKLKYYAKIKN